MRYSRLLLPLLTAPLFSLVFLGLFASPISADNTGFLSLINAYRQQNGLGTLSDDQNLTNAACWFADDMGAKNYFPADHVDSLGRNLTQRLTAFGFGGNAWSENILYTTQGSSAQYAFDAWKNSSGHNANMLNGAYTRIGIGRAFYNNRWYWVTDFSNGGNNAMISQCGVSSNPPPPPPTPPKAKVTPPPAVTPPPPSTVEPPVATPPAEPIATKAATPSAKIIKIDEPEKTEVTLVQGIAATTLILGNLAVFGYIVLRMHRKRGFLKS